MRTEKKNFNLAIITLIALLLAFTSGCGSDNSVSPEEIEELIDRRDILQDEISQLKAEEIQIKEEKGLARYWIKVSIGQTHSYEYKYYYDDEDIDNMIKDNMNTTYLDIPVDKEFYDSVEVGDILDNSFRQGSYYVSDSIGFWDIKITAKYVD